MKFTFFRYFIYIGLLGFVLAILLVVRIQNQVDWKLIYPIIGGFLSYIYFIQKQKVEEIRLFKDLFTECNKRYDKMNEKLNSLYKGDSSEDLAEEEKDYLYDYFNLCGEEYLYFKQGFIIPEAWEAWINGMQFYYRNKRIRDLWEKELKNNCYYGFTIDLLEK